MACSTLSGFVSRVSPQTQGCALGWYVSPLRGPWPLSSPIAEIRARMRGVQLLGPKPQRGGCKSAQGEAPEGTEEAQPWVTAPSPNRTPTGWRYRANSVYRHPVGVPISIATIPRVAQRSFLALLHPGLTYRHPVGVLGPCPCPCPLTSPKPKPKPEARSPKPYGFEFTKKKPRTSVRGLKSES